MTAKELAAASAPFDQPMVVDQSRPLTADEQKRWNRVRRKRGRPKVGKGFKRVSLSIERGLLARANALAKQRRISRSKLIALALQQALAQEP